MNWIFVGNIAGDSSPQAVEIASRLASMPAIALSHGSTFTGKPTTVIHADADWVLKINREHVFQSQPIAIAWCEKRLSQERQYGVYHPRRHWLVQHLTDDHWLAANLTPRMTPLHVLEWSETDDALALIEQLIVDYYRFSASFEHRLDEGFSNFAIDNGIVYYLDDDILVWDDNASFVAMLCRWLRAYSADWLNVKMAGRIGASIREVLLEYRTPFDVELVCEGLKDQFLGEDAQRSRDAVLDGLVGRVKGSAKKRKKAAGINWHQPVGLLADIHANLPALRSILELLEQRGVSQWLVLGDIVGYGPYPAECIAELKARHAVCVRGNHDHYVGHNGQGKVAMSESARWAADWTLRQLGDADRTWLATLPLKIEAEGVLVVHGAPVDRTFFNGYVYEMTYERNLEWLAEKGVHLCFFGHTHLQGVYGMLDGRCLPLCHDNNQDMASFDYALVNPGSVGQPRSGRPGAEAAIFDPASGRLEFIHASYPIEETAGAMQTGHFPDQLIRRLRDGS